MFIHVCAYVCCTGCDKQRQSLREKNIQIAYV